MAQAISVKFRADTSSFTKGVGIVKGGVSKMSGSLKGLVAGFAGVGIGVAGLLGYFQKFRTEMDKLDKYAKSFGESTETFQRLGLGAELSGSNMTNLVNAMAKVKKSITEAQMGTMTYKRAMEALGLSSEELMQLPMEQQLQRLGAAYNASTNKTEAFAHIQTIMGRSAKELIPLLKEVGDSSSETAQAMANMKVVPEETIQAMVKFNDMITTLKQRFQVFFANVVQSAINAWDFIVAAWKGGTLGGIIKEALIIAAKSWVNFTYRNFMAIIKTMGVAIVNSFKASFQIWKGIFNSIPELVELLKKGFAVVGDFLANAILQALNGIEIFGKKLVSDDLADAASANFRDSLSEFGDAAANAGESMAPYVKEAGNLYKEVGKEFVKNWKDTDPLFDVEKNRKALGELVDKTKELLPKTPEQKRGEADPTGEESTGTSKDAKKPTTYKFGPVVSDLQRIGGAAGLTASTTWVTPMVKEQEKTNEKLDTLINKTKPTTEGGDSGGAWR